MRIWTAVAVVVFVVLGIPGIAAAQEPTQDSAMLVGTTEEPGTCTESSLGASWLTALNVAGGPHGEDHQGRIAWSVCFTLRPTLPPSWVSLFDGPPSCLEVRGNVARMSVGSRSIEVRDTSAQGVRDLFTWGNSPTTDPTDCFTAFQPLSGHSIAPPADIQVVDAPADPTIDFVYPVPDAAEVLHNTPVVAVFDEPMDQAATQAAFSLTDASGQPVTGSFSWYGLRALIFDPSQNLSRGVRFTATVSTTARDLEGNPLTSERSWPFITSAGPVLEAIWPQDGTINVPTSTPIVGLFTAAMDQQATANAFSLEDVDTGEPVAGSVVWWGPYAAIFLPSSPLEPFSPYRATIGSGARDADRVPLANPRTWGFSTGATTSTARALSLSAPPAGRGGAAPNHPIVRRLLRERFRPGLSQRAKRLERRLRLGLLPASGGG
jgi:hypothetical protein